MTEAVWSSQAFPPEGASAAEGIRNQLGRPELDLLTILVRESAQNSWDARLGDRPVDYRIDLQNVSPMHAPVWRELLLRNAPPTEHLPFRGSLSGPTIRTLSISDRGTTGLGGPTRADSVVVENHDFVSFVRNIGEPRDTDLGGGTYGFGKGIFYLIASSGAILVHTRCRVGDDFETRLMGCALWKSYVVDDKKGGRRYTGRHWWGERAADDVIEPLTGRKADLVAQRLGLRSFEESETGTSVIVVDPDLEHREPLDAARYLADTITWNLWPKMLADEGAEPPMRFTVTCGGIDVDVPDPVETRPLELFVEAYRAMTSAEEGQELWSLRPKRLLGRLGLEKRIMLPVAPSEAGSVMGIETTVHHVCLMRTAELVVTYYPGPKPPAEHVSYAGVFRADRELDAVFAEAEPPTHDAWRWHLLDGERKSFVRRTFQRLKESLTTLIEVGDRVRAGAAEMPLGAASRTFAALVAGAWGIGGGTNFGRSGAERAPDVDRRGNLAHDEEDKFAPYELSTEASGPQFAGDAQDDEAGFRSASFGEGGENRSLRRPRVEYIDEPSYESRDGQVVLVQLFRLPEAGLQRVRAELAVALPGTGTRETDPPKGAPAPTLLGWEDETGELDRLPALTVEGGDLLRRAIVLPAPDTMTDIGLVVERVDSR